MGPIRNEAGHQGSGEISKLEQNRGVIHTSNQFQEVAIAIVGVDEGVARD